MLCLILLGVEVLALMAGSINQSTPDDRAAKLAGDWKLVKLDEAAIPVDVKITLAVTAEGKVSGTTGVNRFFGGLAKEKTLFGPLGMTQVAGSEEAMKREAAYTKALAEVTDFTVKGEQLQLSAGDKPRLTFTRVKPDEPK